MPEIQGYAVQDPNLNRVAEPEPQQAMACIDPAVLQKWGLDQMLNMNPEQAKGVFLEMLAKGAPLPEQEVIKALCPELNRTQAGGSRG